MEKSEKDQLYASKLAKIKDFEFDENVANVFSDMIQRSVPGYELLNQFLPIVASQFIQPNTNVYDLGCSLGEAAISIANYIHHENVEIYAVDNSIAMIETLQNRIMQVKSNATIRPQLHDVNNVAIHNASFVVLNYTLQFIERNKRYALLEKIYNSLIDNGALLLSEKITYENKSEDSLMQKLHEEYKRRNEYSELEISQKREALENVLIRDTHEQHIMRLKKAGFSKVSVLAQYLNFTSYLAVK